MWPGLVGKGRPGTAEPPIEPRHDARAYGESARSTASEIRRGRHLPFRSAHQIDISEEDLKKIADKIAGKGLDVGSLVAPVWPGRQLEVPRKGTRKIARSSSSQVTKACRIAQLLNEHGVRKYGASESTRPDNPSIGPRDPAGNTKKIVETFREAAEVAQDHGERLAAEGEVCWGGMHSWQNMVDLLERVGMREVVGFQADLAHTYLYLLGVNAPEDALLKAGCSSEQFDAAYKTVTDALRPWTIDFHVAQNDGTVNGTGSHDKTGRHCPRGRSRTGS